MAEAVANDLGLAWKAHVVNLHEARPGNEAPKGARSINSFQTVRIKR